MLPQQSINGGSGGAAFWGCIPAGFSPPSGLPPLRENFGGSITLTMEAAAMATTLTLTHFCFCGRAPFCADGFTAYGAHRGGF